MSILWTAADAAAATGGQATTDWKASGLSIDTRTLQPGDLFVALKDVRDGHDFVADALTAGAAAALVSRIPDGLAEDAPLLLVPDVLPALEALGRAGRARAKAKVIGVTGSVGKTTTKEMLRTLFAGQGKVHAAEKSFNNHWGVPITLARLPQDADFAVIEIGMNHPGEISPLAQMAQLDVALVTIVAPAHLEAFESIEGIAREKAAIFDGLKQGGVAVINADLETGPILQAAAERSGAQVLRFGRDAAADFVLEDVAVYPDTTVAQARIKDQPLLFKVKSSGAHFAMNALCAIATVQAAGGDLGRAVVAMALWVPFAGRGARTRIVLDDTRDDVFLELIDDSYNANPASVGAALDMLAATEPQDGLGRVSRGRRIAVLGDMLELGKTSSDLHASLAAHPAMDQITKVHCVGPLMRNLWEAMPEPKRGVWTQTSDDLRREIHAQVDAGDVVMVKGSLGIKLAVVVDAIKKLGQADPQQKKT